MPTIDLTAKRPAPDYRSQNQLHYAAALTAFTMITPITITVDQSECADGHPEIVSIMLRRKNGDLPERVEAISDQLNSISNRLDTLEQHVNDAHNQTNQLITQRADQGSAQGNQIASKVDQVEQFLLGFSREVARDSSGRTLINLVGSIAQKVGAP
jgi:archaellum component FlaC